MVNYCLCFKSIMHLMFKAYRDVDPERIGERSLPLNKSQRFRMSAPQKLRTDYGLKEDTNALLSIPADLYQ